MSLQDIANVATVAQLLLWVVVTFGGSILVIKYIQAMKPVWKRFSDNVSREVVVVSTEKQAMEHEADMLKRVGYFKVKSVSADMRNVDLLRGSVLIVVGYSPDSEVYDKTLAFAKDNGLPIIVYSGLNRLSDGARTELKNYSFSSLCETDLRLVSDVFAVMSTFPDAK